MSILLHDIKCSINELLDPRKTQDPNLDLKQKKIVTRFRELMQLKFGDLNGSTGYIKLGKDKMGNDVNRRGLCQGTWAILHHLSIQWDDEIKRTTADDELRIIADFIYDFFPCPGCGSHFNEMYHGTIDQNDMGFIEKIWRFHNEVNYDLAHERVSFYPITVRGDGYRVTRTQLRPGETKQPLWPTSLLSDQRRPLNALYTVDELRIAETEIRKCYTTFI